MYSDGFVRIEETRRSRVRESYATLVLVHRSGGDSEIPPCYRRLPSGFPGAVGRPRKGRAPCADREVRPASSVRPSACQPHAARVLRWAGTLRTNGFVRIAGGEHCWPVTTLHETRRILL